ncbi:DUF3574 domain-containing protein [Streptomyces sp. MST-110588]|uniref:DUF3574 domain-containing protein n=1 Tax=Streptomyces sp. MST-110588 TaxID=2833628 RepID=UPI001F5CF818|nr:DUF3574 domain-containing protein [Streptomyces sp. MST-110588]UNO40490.1 DUF3574 domain-containing protein [Streptomyces sp. MST-110588]
MTMTKPRMRLAAVALTAGLLGAGAPVAYASLDDDSEPAIASAKPAAEGSPYIETSLMFGTARPNGGPPVTDKQFRAFVDTYVTPRFPSGLTVQDGYGQYRDTHGKIERERSYELILLYPTSQSRPAGTKIEAIRKEYMKRYAQESVARIDDRTRVDF